MKGLEGTRLGRYELLCLIAQGGMSEVYLGYDRRVRRKVAVKVLYGNDEPFVRRFEREAQAVGTLSHDHILPLYDFGTQHPWYYLVMPFIEGGTLRDYLIKRERLPLEEAGSFLDQMASALQHAHDHGVIHRDVKPSNILLRQDGHAYLVDFGLAKAKREAEALTHTGTMIGTPEYMAPEQSNGVNDHRSDIYSLGIILYQMLTGQVPFSGETPVAVTLKHLQSTPPSPSQLNSTITQAIEEVMLKALAKAPEERYQQARDLSIAYQHKLDKQQIHIQVGDSETLQEEQEEITDDEIQNAPDQEQQATTLVAARELSPRPRLYPLAYEKSPLPLTINVKKRRRWLWPALSLAGLLIIGMSFTFFLKTRFPDRGLNTIQQIIATLPQRNATTEQARALQLQATLAAQARVQTTAGITSAIGAGTMLYSHDMTVPGGGWMNDGTQCHFSPQGYLVSTSTPHAAAWCYSNQQRFSDAVITTQARILRGDFYGLVFRLNPDSKEFYVLELNSQGQYRFQRAHGQDPTGWLTLIDWTYSAAITQGYGQTNTFLVVATGVSFRFYINQQLIVSTFSDIAYNNGLIGFLVGGDSSLGSGATFTNIGVFQR